jgi:uncharacterized membrane protein
MAVAGGEGLEKLEDMIVRAAESSGKEGFWMSVISLLKRLEPDAVFGIAVLAICLGAVLKGTETIPTFLFGGGVLALVYMFKWLQRFGRKDCN